MASVTLTAVTDPACTWCWGMEPVFGRVAETYRDQVEFEYVMGGLVEDFDDFRDPANGVTDPRDVAPHWETAAERHGMPVDPSVWTENPPTSTYPACRAYEAAELQDPDVAATYLRRLREAVAVERRDVSDEAVLRELAGDVGLDLDAYDEAIEDGRAEAAFEADREFVRRHGATAFPSVRVRAGTDERWLHGYTPFDALDDALRAVEPGLVDRDPRPPAAFVDAHGRVATREVAAVYGLDDGRALQILRSLADEGVVSGEAVGSGYLWTAADPQDRVTENGADDHPASREDPGAGGGGACTLSGDCAPDVTGR